MNRDVASAEFVLLRDGDQVLIRPFAPDDRGAVADLFARLSPQSRAMRFHAGAVHIDGRTLDLVTAGHALVAERTGRLVALASYYPLRDPARAEMAIAVDDAEQGRGIGTALFERLSQDARRAGITRLLAEVLASNRGMLGMLHGLGFRTTRQFAGGVVEVDVELRPDPAYVARADARLHVAAAASLEPMFRPRAVAVVGASRQPGSVGYVLFRNLLTGGFAGAVYPVNPAAVAVASVRAYARVADIPEPIDLAVLVVPAAVVLDTARASLDAGVRALIVISAGFAESGDEGRRRQEELRTLCHARGARLIGPNCLGVLVNTPEGALNATLAPTLPPPGGIAISSQSGALGIAILEQARRLGLGIAAFASIGNKADVSSNDLLERWEDDPATRLILLYLESFGNPRRFARIARRLGARKPILVVKGGRGEGARRAAVSPTAALAGADVAVDALFRQSGVTRCDTLEELFDVAALLTHQPLPEGNRVAILTNSGGLGVLCADACTANGLQVPPLPAATQAALRDVLPPDAAVANPVDMPASGAAADYGAALRLLLAAQEIDAVIVLFIPPLVATADDVAAQLRAACDPPPHKPVLACFTGMQGTPDVLRGAVVIPSYTYPEAAARALGHAARRAAWLRRAAGAIPTLAGVDTTSARTVVDRAKGREGSPWLTPDEVQQLLRAYGIALPDEVMARSPEEAAEACRRLGGPVAVKLAARHGLHKTDVGGVHLWINTPAQAAEAYRAIAVAAEAHGQAGAMDGALVQPMVSGVECLVGVVSDPVFGPLIAFGLGGVLAEVIGDVAFRVHPLTDVDADELIASARASIVLRGYRGSPPADIAALRDLLLRVSQLVEDVPAIAEIDMNPVMARADGQGVLVLDARVKLVG